MRGEDLVVRTVLATSYRGDAIELLFSSRKLTCVDIKAPRKRG